MTNSRKFNGWEADFKRELDQAEKARQAGNEAKARVCARRAAGIAITEYINRNGIEPSGSSAYALLKFLQSYPLAPQDARDIAGHFLERVTPEFVLPGDMDLIQDARWLAQRLLSPDHI